MAWLGNVMLSKQKQNNSRGNICIGHHYCMCEACIKVSLILKCFSNSSPDSNHSIAAGLHSMKGKLTGLKLSVFNIWVCQCPSLPVPGLYYQQDIQHTSTQEPAFARKCGVQLGIQNHRLLASIVINSPPLHLIHIKCCLHRWRRWSSSSHCSSFAV